MDRREFVVRLGAIGSVAAGGLVTSALAACGAGGEGTAPGDDTKKDFGLIEGVVFDLGGVPQPSLGQIFLMDKSGLQTGRYVPVNAKGEFSFPDVAPGEWQLRFYAPRRAYVPEEFEHPMRVTVGPRQTVSVRITVEVQALASDMIEIYVGDGFFQEQPLGKENGETVVKLGTPVCWYNVGNQIHSVTGGPWNDSGDLQRTGSYIWVADRVGLFAYRCRFHSASMQATLRVIA
jgi:plastocyanin